MSKRPRNLAVAFGSVNALLWVWLYWFTNLFAVRNSLEAGVGQFFVGMLFMGLGLLLFFPLAGVISLVYGTGIRVSETAIIVLWAICGLIGWSTTGYGIGKLVDRRAK